jgi:hypothetical protein
MAFEQYWFRIESGTIRLSAGFEFVGFSRNLPMVKIPLFQEDSAIPIDARLDISPFYGSGGFFATSSQKSMQAFIMRMPRCTDAMRRRFIVFSPAASAIP